MKKGLLMVLAATYWMILGACSAGNGLTKTEITQRNHRKARAKQAPINSLHYAKRYWKPKYQRDSFLSFLSKKPAKKPKPTPEYTHE